MTRDEFVKKFKVGDKIRHDNEGMLQTEELTAIGKLGFLATLEHGREARYTFDECNWLPAPTPKKLAAPAMVKSKSCGCWDIQATLYVSLEEAQADWPTFEVHWPAIPNADGMYELPEDK